VVDGQRWWFDTKAFDEVREYVEEQSAWKYSGGADLILANARCIMGDTGYGKLPSLQIDFSSAISVELPHSGQAVFPQHASRLRPATLLFGIGGLTWISAR
jgi:hypothetical protein